MKKVERSFQTTVRLPYQDAIAFALRVHDFHIEQSIKDPNNKVFHESQARRITNDSLLCNKGGQEFTLSEEPNFWELDEYSSIRQIGTADKGLWVQLVSYNWSGN